MATPDITNFNPMYIQQTINKAAKTAVTAERWNELWNLVIAQGDYNSEAIDLICDDLLLQASIVYVDGLDAQNVKITGDQSIAGIKTFTSSPIVPVATTDTQAPQKLYVDTGDATQQAYTDAEIADVSGVGRTTETIKGNADDLTTHKTSSDHDSRYYTESELDPVLTGLQNQINSNDADIVALNALITALNDTFSTDAERIAAINQVIADYEAADTSITDAVALKANAADVYTKAQIDAMTLGAYKFGYYTDYGTITGGDSATVTIDIAEYVPDDDLIWFFMGGVILTKDVDYTVDNTTKVATKINNDGDATWADGTRWDAIVIKNVRVVVPEDEIDGVLLKTATVPRTAITAAFESDIATLEADVTTNTSDIASLVAATTPVVLSSIGRSQSEFDFAGATVSDVTDTDGSVTLDAGQTSGTIEKVYSPADLRAWRNLKVNVANLDASNNLYYKLDDRKLSVDAEWAVPDLSGGGLVRAFLFNSDGSSVYTLDGLAQVIRQYNLSTKWMISTAGSLISTLDISSEVTTARNMCFNHDFTKLYVTDISNNTIYQYSPNLTTIGSSSYDSKSFDTSTQVTAASLSGITVNSDSSKFYVTDFGSDNIFQYSMTSSDISTGSYDTKLFSVSLKEGTTLSVQYISNSKFIFAGSNADSVHEYSMTSDDISTGSFVASFNFSNEETSVQHVQFGNNGKYIYQCGAVNSTIFQYKVVTSNSVATIQSYSLLDTETPIVANTELTDNGINVIDLSSIDLSTYPNDLVLTYTLQRDTTGDTSPTISNNSIAWEGTEANSTALLNFKRTISMKGLV